MGKKGRQEKTGRGGTTAGKVLRLGFGSWGQTVGRRRRSVGPCVIQGHCSRGERKKITQPTLVMKGYTGKQTKRGAENEQRKRKASETTERGPITHHCNQGTLGESQGGTSKDRGRNTVPAKKNLKCLTA